MLHRSAAVDDETFDDTIGVWLTVTGHSNIATRAGLAYELFGMKPPDFSREWNRLMDPSWRKARIAARLILKREEGKPWSGRDRRLAQRFAADPGVINRLVDQAMHSHKARKQNGRSILDLIP